MADEDRIEQSEIEEMLRQGEGVPVAKVASTSKKQLAAESGDESAPSGSDVGDDIHFLLSQAEDAIASVDRPRSAKPSRAAPFAFQELRGSTPSTEKATIELLRDVELDVKIELGRTNMFLEDVLKLRRGSVVPLEKLAGDPVDIYVNGRLIARGEVLVLNDSFCVRVAELVSGDDLE
jgi:flagellar motor switch protein FliN